MSKKVDKSIRDGFGEGLLELGESNSKVVALSADLRDSVRIGKFADRYPGRFFEVGISEQNMAGIAAGLALSGKIPYMGTFASFQPMRNLDQIRTSICMMNAPVKIISSHAGFSHAADGVQIQALEDLAIMRSLPNMQVFSPADAAQAAQITKLVANTGKPAYIRLGRSATPDILTSKLVNNEGSLQTEIGKAQLLRAGGDGVIIATGYMVMQALKAAKELQNQNIHVSVLNIHTIKPLDVEAILSAVEHSRNVLTVEEHQIYGGLGSAVSEVLATSGLSFNFKMIGVEDKFGITAESQEYLWQKYGLDVTTIVQKFKTLLD